MSRAKIATVPNLITLMRLGCLPLFLLLLKSGDRGAAAWLLGGLCATDWVDGWIARRFQQTSAFGEVFDPAVDRILFVVSTIAILIDGAMPLWFGLAILIREIGIGAGLLIATAFGMERFSVSIWGKRYTFLLMFAVPLMLLGADSGRWSNWVTIAAWVLGVPGLVMSYYTAVGYVPTIRKNLRIGRAARRG